MGAAMMGMGATLTVADFVALVRDPRGLALGLVAHLLLLPALAFAFARLLDLDTGWALGLYMVSVVPPGAMSNLLTFVGRGNAALSISITLAATLGCVVTAPLLLGFMAAAELPADFALPAFDIIGEIAAYLIAPLLAGMLLRHLRPAQAPAASRWLVRLAVVGLIVVASSSLASGRIRVLEYGVVPPLRILAFGAAMTTGAGLLARVLGRPDRDVVALMVPAAIRNIAVSLILIQFFFPGTEVQAHILYTCLFYGGSSMFYVLPAVLRHRYGRGPLIFVPRRPVVEPE
ncbi:MAG TPA: bile acid:sodium symporter [Kofleriaceae bacterium]|nr:bile acid:sodium symporter [Kofleriaceae bacterium]